MFRADESKQIADLLGVARLASMGARWESQACELEELIALASWRSQSLEVRVAALVDALAAVHVERVYESWGSDEL